MLEICTDPDSTLGQVVSEAGDSICRYTAQLDFRLRATVDAALEDIKKFPGAHVMASIPCTAGSSWQKLNLRRGGARQRQRVLNLKQDMRTLLANLSVVAHAARSSGGTISFEWPRHCSLWQEQPVRNFIE